MAEPPLKKVKKAENFDEFIENIMNSKTNLVAVVDNVFTDPVPLTKFYAGRVKDMKQLSRIILLLNEKLPLTGYSHLKRVCRSCVLICTVDHFSDTCHESIQDYIESYIPELKDVFEYIKDADVPAIAPLTKRQNSVCRFKWATNFHPSTHYEALLSDFVFSTKELQLHRTYMSMVFQIAKICLSNLNIDPKVEDIINWDVNAGIVVDSIKQSIVAIGLDNRKNHPIQHSAMVAIDNVAKTQNGGAWMDNNHLTLEIIEKMKEKYPEINFGARKYVSKRDEADTAMVESSPYLCTGYDIYLVREPCVMCAMGLVHARMKRVFYTLDNALLGAVNSKTKLHCVKHLNHRFEVFTGF